ncbi:hypothetical protein KIN20_008352 [Parelaphostrongylus tenuis]|uniref:Rho-GAP domain-containing protein n=1 Tax=Parelaphostrongylus tenuis TaxID=148309 RepID=A0AAD5QJS3_PARTN|nr:hypothetical protein KIN20_008352 [Parelaphostrongylus tenuis]
MNCGNLAIVFGPNLLGGDIDGNITVGTKVNESILISQSQTAAELSESFSMSSIPTPESDDSFDEYQDECVPGSMSRSQGDLLSSAVVVPRRPPPPNFRNETEAHTSRPVSYNKVVGAEPAPAPRTRLCDSVIMESSSSYNGSASIKRPTILNREDIMGNDVSNSFKTVVSVEATPLPARNKPPLPAKPRSGDNETSRL